MSILKELGYNFEKQIDTDNKLEIIEKISKEIQENSDGYVNILMKNKDMQTLKVILNVPAIRQQIVLFNVVEGKDGDYISFGDSKIQYNGNEQFEEVVMNYFKDDNVMNNIITLCSLSKEVVKQFKDAKEKESEGDA